MRRKKDENLSMVIPLEAANDREMQAGGEIGGSLSAPSSTQFIRDKVRFSPLGREELGEGKHEAVQLQGVPERFFTQKEHLLLWPDDRDHISRMNRQGVKKYSGICALHGISHTCITMISMLLSTPS